MAHTQVPEPNEWTLMDAFKLPQLRINLPIEQFMGCGLIYCEIFVSA